MKIVFEHTPIGIGDNIKHKVEITTDAETIYEVLHEIKNALVAYGFHTDTVDKGFQEIAEDIKEK